MGLRELKKLKTRKAISDMATLLFVERGYHDVTIAEIALRAEVSVPTLFNYFPTKESLVFDEDSAKEKDLIAAVTDRQKGQTILNALLELGLKNIDSIKHFDKKIVVQFLTLVEETPELQAYSKQMWMRYEKSLGEAIRKDSASKSPPLEAEAIARFVLDSYHRSYTAPQPKAALKRLFKILQDGWNE